MDAVICWTAIIIALSVWSFIGWLSFQDYKKEKNKMDYCEYQILKDKIVAERMRSEAVYNKFK